MKKIHWFILLLLFSRSLMAAPTGEDLLTACEDAQKNGYQSQQGMLCIWYVTPCDCHFGKETTMPRVCLASDISHESLAEDVITGLHDQSQLLTETAEMAAAVILAPKYPCQD